MKISTLFKGFVWYSLFSVEQSWYWIDKTNSPFKFLALFVCLFVVQVRNEKELIEAIETATGEKKDCLCFIEVIVHKDDTSKELLEWGSRVSSANSRLPNPQ